MNAIQRMSLHQRIQHGVLLLAAVGALVTGLGIPAGFPAAIAFGDWYRFHRLAGLGAAFAVAYHAVYLLVRGYVEGANWSVFPLAPRRSDWADTRGELGYLLGRRAERPAAGTFRVSQKCFYWSTGILVTSLALSGLSISGWERAAGTLPLSALPPLALAHRCLALLLLGASAGHLYGTLFWNGLPWPQWSWITGTITEEMAAAKVPGHLKEQLRLREERLAGEEVKSALEKEEEERSVEREKVERDLREGNRLAREERFVEALFHYRRALELYPGYSQARYNMAVVLGKMGERTMAAENFRQFLSEDPFHPLAGKAREHLAEMEGTRE